MRAISHGPGWMFCALLVTGCAGETPDDGGITSFSDGPMGETQQPLSLAAPCDGNNHLNTNVLDAASMGGPMVAIQWIPAATETVAYLEIFTGEKVGVNQLALWSDNGAVVGQPLAPLATSAPFTTAWLKGWQGAALTAPVTVLGGNKYWVVWDPSGAEQTSANIDPADLQQPYWGSFSGNVSGGATWFGPFSSFRWKFRTFCGGCKTIQRGTGGFVSDAFLRSANPSTNFGAGPALFTGNLLGGTSQSLLSFDTSVVPPGANVNLAKLHLQSSAPTVGTVSAHQVTAPWSEASVTWSSFAASYNPVAETSASTLGGGYFGPLSLDISGLGAGWVQGSIPNYGLLVTQPTGYTGYASSENTTTSYHPALDVCWDPLPIPKTCPLGGRPFGNTLCGATTPCALHADELVSATQQFRNDVPAVAIDEACTAHVLYSEAYVTFSGFHGIRTGPGAWSVSSTPFPLATTGAEPLGGAGIYAIANDGGFGISANAWDGTTWSAPDPAPYPGVVINAGVAQASAGGAVHVAYEDTSLGATAFRYGTYQGIWNVGTVVEPFAFTPFLALSPQDDPHFAYWGGTAVPEIRWRTTTTPSEIVSSLAVTGFINAYSGVAATGADPQNPEGKPHVVWLQQAGAMDSLMYGTRTGTAAWSTQILAQVPHSDICPYPPLFAGVDCAFVYDSLAPIAVVGTESGSVRVFFTAPRAVGTYVSDCYDPSFCFWTNPVVSVQSAPLQMAVIEPGQPVTVVTFAAVTAWASPYGSAAIDNLGGMHLAFYDYSSDPVAFPTVRYVHLGF